ncbi:hypothetical protein SAMN05216573_113129 [Bradyrhizobium sp. Rc3b]|nr:hypothetical protein [Bradyrhizobium sp. SBR1B]SFN45268.1 hypothetical protein SAMN05216573_113129 [Bradyrhizobium sp. Rc3b]
MSRVDRILVCAVPFASIYLPLRRKLASFCRIMLVGLRSSLPSARENKSYSAAKTSNDIAAERTGIQRRLERYRFDRAPATIIAPVSRLADAGLQTVRQVSRLALRRRSNRPVQSSRPNSCCPGPLPRKPLPRSTWSSCNTKCGCIIADGGKWVEIKVRRSALPASIATSREKILALRPGSASRCTLQYRDTAPAFGSG